MSTAVPISALVRPIIRRCQPDEFETVHRIINDAAQAYRGVIPADCWKEPYMPAEELRHALQDGVVFWGFEENAALLGLREYWSISERQIETSIVLGDAAWFSRPARPAVPETCAS